jgi:hypothetical protein
MNSISKKTIITAAVITFVIALASCIKDVDDVNLPNTPQKLVVQSFISPSDSIFVTVFASQPLNYNIPVNDYSWGSVFDTIKTATVSITNITNLISVNVPYFPEQKKYVLPPNAFTIEKGSEYELTVTANNFESVTARTVVPLGNATSVIERIDTISIDEWGNMDMRVIGSIDDPANEKNYYSILTYGIKEYTWDDMSNIYISNFSSSLMSDNQQDGNSISVRHEFYDYEDEYTEIKYTKTEVYEVDEHYYNFHSSLETIYDIMDNPFTESSHLYSNIEGGLGVFGSYVTINSTTLNK